jgi:hypothetical protein
VTSAAEFSPREGLAAAAFKGRLWVIGGQRPTINGNWLYNDVWNSLDGATWTEATPAAEFSPRAGHAVMVLDDKLWVMGGAYQNDVWNSEDGIHWEQVTASAGFRPESQFTGLSFRDKFFVFGGEHSWDKDIWLSGSGPAASVTPGLINFGWHDIATGPSLPLAAILSNLYPQGWEPLHILNVTIENDATGAYSLAKPPNRRILLLGDDREYGVVFDPTVEGEAEAVLRIATDDPAHPELEVPLVGVGLAPGSLNTTEWLFR